MAKPITASSSSTEQSQIEFWRQHPVQAALDILGPGGNGDDAFDLDRPQRVIINSRWTHQYELDIFTRGGGKTLCNAVTAVLGAILYPGNRIGFIAPSFRQSKMMFEEVRKLYEISPAVQDCCVDDPKTTPEKCYLKFKAAPGHVGSVIEALPLGQDGSKIRGARYYWVFADELAQIDSNVLDIVVGGFLATQANPMARARQMKRMRAALDRGEITQDELERATAGTNKFVGSSTAFYQYNHLWTRAQKIIEAVHQTKQVLIRKGEPHGHLVTRGGPLNEGQIPARYLSDGKQALAAFNWLDMSEGFLARDWILQQKERMSEYMFRMEYGCYFPPDSDGFFHRSLLDACRRHNSFGPVIVPRRGMIYAMGLDPARTSDNFACSLWEVDLDMMCCRLVRIYTWHKQPFPHVHTALRDIIRTFNVKRIKMDSGGGGTTMRDLFAEQANCPIGDKLILEEGFSEHQGLQGNRILAPLAQFSNYEWLKDVHEAFKSAMEHGKVLIAAPAPVPGEIYVPEMDEADAEIESTLVEISSVITTAQGNRLHWDTPTKSQRKDRYSATLLGFDAANEILQRNLKPQQLVTGFWM